MIISTTVITCVCTLCNRCGLELPAETIPF